MNRSFRAEETGLSRRQPQQMGSLRTSMMREKEDELALFLEMRKREKERNDLLLLHNSDEFDAPLGQRSGSSPIFNITSNASAPVRKTATDDFLNSDNDKNDYDWLLTPPGTPLFPSLEMEAQKTAMSQLGTPKARPLALKSRLANPQMEPAPRSTLSRQPTSSPGVTPSSAGIRRPSSSGGSRPSTPTGRPTLSGISKPAPTSAPKPTTSAGSKSSTTSRATSATISRPTRSATPTRTTSSVTKPTVPSRSSTPTSRATTRSSTPTSRSTPTARSSIPPPKPASRSSTPTRRPSTVSATTVTSAPPVKSTSSVTKSVSSTVKNPVQPRPSSPTVKPRPWKPSDIPGFSLDAPPNLRTSLSDRPISASRGRPGAPSVRSSSVEPASNGRVRRQSCSPSRGRPPNGIVHGSGSSVPAGNRLYAKANDNVSPVLYGTKMVERVINMRKLIPPKQDDKHSPLSNLSGKSSSPDSSGFGRTLSKKSLDMAIRHMVCSFFFSQFFFFFIWILWLYMDVFS
ncbi:OLC1v1026772C4 [Oldenlandia corymbosa var. corymbosa]|uniref:OLC1v1026772C4 n=1 Tax=Oldenlandia corymbosa var. corymbosa TaxID=529605 RepID=A0AAV1C8E7_OLDCO|nr:OLC1v1026772C4 [Oldenlandia corymbosa var. corymbosa]